MAKTNTVIILILSHVITKREQIILLGTNGTYIHTMRIPIRSSTSKSQLYAPILVKFEHTHN